MNDKDLDNLLNEQHVPPAASNLPARIIDAAKLPERVSLIDRIKGKLYGAFLLPKPAYALAVFVLIGLIVYGVTEVPTRSVDADLIDAEELWGYLTDDNGNWL